MLGPHQCPQHTGTKKGKRGLGHSDINHSFPTLLLFFGINGCLLESPVILFSKHQGGP